MSIQTEITRLQGLRNTLRAALVALGLAQSAADLEDCVTAVEGIKNNGAVSGAITDAATPYNVPAGYHNGQGTVGIANTEKEKLVADGAEAAGTMPNNGAVQASIDGLTQTEYTVPAGYHTGTGKVSLTGDIEEALAAI